jgi:hypothetical protein
MIALAFPLAILAGLLIGTLASLMIRRAARIEAERAAKLQAFIINSRRKALEEMPRRIGALEARSADLLACGQLTGADYYANEARVLRRRLEIVRELAAA